MNINRVIKFDDNDVILFTVFAVAFLYTASAW